ncbi:MAG TPA: hypothetical protein VF006_12615 [Longimicrobium sp.]
MARRHPSSGVPLVPVFLLPGGAALLLFASMGMCYGGEEAEGCTAEYVYGIHVTASDARTGEALDSVSGLVREGAWVDTLRETWGPPAMAAGERPGTYALEVRAPGYATWETAGVVAPDLGCHVGTKKLHARLSPLGGR